MWTFFETLTPFFEIAVIAVMLNYLLSFFWNTRSMDLMLGAVAFLLILAASTWLGLPILNKIMYFVTSTAVTAVLIIFQPELRVALSKLSLKGKRYKEMTEFDKFLDQLANSVYRLADKRMGALIVLENKDSLNEFSQKAVLLNAIFSSEIIESIFTINTPLHDGAVIIRDGVILAAAVILPLAEESSEITKSMGTRHRAALGASQQTDALIIVVSEESGRVAIARDGIITKGVKVDRFKGIIRSVFSAPQESMKKEFKILEWIKQ